MLSENEIQRYKEMDPEERYQIFLEAAAYAWHCMNADGEEMAKKRWALIRKQHDESSRRLEEKFRELS